MTSKPKAITVVRAVSVVEKQGTCIFNDKMQDGRRSIKVWGWTNNTYKKCVDTLRDYGYNVSVRYKNNCPDQIHRIWVG